MRGEDSAVAYGVRVDVGSPPHARGRHSRLESPSREAGITPACAGKTARAGSRVRGSPDHPRMRGEDGSARLPRDRGVGSPPHARGRQPKHWPMLVRWRITPACAGKTPTCGLSARDQTDHPRMRGEDQGVPWQRRFVGGSPPHARGRLSTLRTPRRSCRITPACAGKTLCQRPRSSR